MNISAAHHSPEVEVEVGEELLHRLLEEMETETEVGHAWFIQLPQTIVFHQIHKHTEGILLRHLEREWSQSHVTCHTVTILILRCNDSLLSLVHVLSL